MAFLWQHPNSQYWIARFYDQEGKRRNRTTKVRVKGSTPAETRSNRKSATLLADEFEEASRRRRTVLNARRVIAELTEELSGQKLTGKSLREHTVSWLNRKESEIRLSSYKFYKGCVGRFLDFMEELGLADEDISFITSEHVLRYRDQRREQVAAKTTNHDLKCLRMLFKAAKREHLIADDPTEFVDTVRDNNQKTRRGFTVDEISALLKVADDEWRSMILFGVYTGQRLADLSNLTWNNIDLEKKEIRLTTRKTGKVLFIPIAPPLLEHIESLPVSDDPNQSIHSRSFDKFNRHGRVNNLSNDFANLLYDAGLRAKKVSHTKKEQPANDNDGKASSSHRTYELSFHSLRHTAVTLLHDAGVPMAVTKALIGHDSSAMHEIYIGVGKDALSDAAKKLPNLVSPHE